MDEWHWAVWYISFNQTRTLYHHFKTTVYKSVQNIKQYLSNNERQFRLYFYLNLNKDVAQRGETVPNVSEYATQTDPDGLPPRMLFVVFYLFLTLHRKRGSVCLCSRSRSSDQSLTAHFHGS